MTEILIVINPGSTSTKLAFYSRNGEEGLKSIKHGQKELDKFDGIIDQLDYRLTMVREHVHSFLSLAKYKVIGVVGRGGIVKPLEGGTYEVDEYFLQDAWNGTYGDHASNLGSLLANKLKDEYGLKTCYTVDPVSSGNIMAKAEVSGVPSIKRNRRGHPLNMKMTARKIAQRQNIAFEESNYIIAHLGGGISIAWVKGGKILDVNDALMGMGPFSPNRAGALPLLGLMDLCYSQQRKEVEKLLTKNSGFKAYLGTEDISDVLKMIEDGDEYAKLIYEAFVYQVAKEVGAYFSASKGKAKSIIITGRS